MTTVVSGLNAAKKAAIYAEVKRDIEAVLDGEPNVTARMATVSCLLAQAFDYYFWTGFYVVDEVKKAQGLNELVIGPYQGTLGCLRIAYTRGVCGAAAMQRQTIIVEDVHAFQGHIACDSRSNSEIVVPVFDASGELIAVFDVDSEAHGSFDDADKAGLEAIMASVFAKPTI
ncbi:GAF domain-containing protein [Asticcacaulis sp. ZE23SCel15]|uniref:GAF domain-containing protein n=1 Tax=Asticcacaulis sp. ZE23SCel15 TaxID=3059027 RepID=UPI0026604528|nr:GAF domain-containing protein [Asticcacaulis sp. ZE23SCel15]WKL55852.1 GAF domain-containing protein [Asticcacaulis sp. ZE23SCel15]